MSKIFILRHPKAYMLFGQFMRCDLYNLNTCALIVKTDLVNF